MTGNRREKVGTSPPKPMPGMESSKDVKAAGTDEVDAHGVGASQAVGSRAVGVGG